MHGWDVPFFIVGLYCDIAGKCLYHVPLPLSAFFMFLSSPVLGSTVFGNHSSFSASTKSRPFARKMLLPVTHLFLLGASDVPFDEGKSG
jgi:hypothetical protein